MLEVRLVPSAQRGTDPGRARGDDRRRRGRAQTKANARDSLCGDASGTAFVVFKARAARREKEVELRRLDFATVERRGLPVVDK